MNNLPLLTSGDSLPFLTSLGLLGTTKDGSRERPLWSGLGTAASLFCIFWGNGILGSGIGSSWMGCLGKSRLHQNRRKVLGDGEPHVALVERKMETENIK